MKIFDQIDNYFKERDKKEFYYVLVGIVFLIGFIFFYYLYPLADNYHKRNLNEFNNVSNNLKREIKNLNGLKKEYSDLTNEFKRKTNELVSLKKESTFYSQLVSVLDFATFNRYKWANFVKNMINDANNEGLKVKIIENKIIKENNSSSNIVKNMVISMKVEGGYKNFIHYIYQYEKLKDLVRVGEMSMDANGSYGLEIDIYGYRK